MLNLKKLCALTDTNEKCVQFLQEHNIVHCNRLCRNGHEMYLYFNERYIRWRCRKRKCSQDIGLRKGTWLHPSTLDLDDIILFIYGWAYEMTSVKWCQREVKMSQTTVVDWNNFLREVCLLKLMSKQNKIGGENTTVEIDKALFVRRKSSADLPSEQWVIGGICRETKETFLQAVPDKNRETFLSVIEEHVLPGSIIITDEWKSYRELYKKGHKNQTVDLSQNFADLQSGGNALRVKRLLKSSRDRYKKQCGIQQEMIDSYMAEFLWRYDMKDKDPFIQILHDIATLFPPEQIPVPKTELGEKDDSEESDSQIPVVKVEPDDEEEDDDEESVPKTPVIKAEPRERDDCEESEAQIPSVPVKVELFEGGTYSGSKSQVTRTNGDSEFSEEMECSIKPQEESENEQSNHQNDEEEEVPVEIPIVPVKVELVEIEDNEDASPQPESKEDNSSQLSDSEEVPVEIPVFPVKVEPVDRDDFKETVYQELESEEASSTVKNEVFVDEYNPWNTGSSVGNIFVSSSIDLENKANHKNSDNGGGGSDDEEFDPAVPADSSDEDWQAGSSEESTDESIDESFPKSGRSSLKPNPKDIQKRKLDEGAPGSSAPEQEPPSKLLKLLHCNSEELKQKSLKDKSFTVEGVHIVGDGKSNAEPQIRPVKLVKLLSGGIAAEGIRKEVATPSNPKQNIVVSNQGNPKPQQKSYIVVKTLPAAAGDSQQGNLSKKVKVIKAIGEGGKIISPQHLSSSFLNAISNINYKKQPITIIQKRKGGDGGSGSSGQGPALPESVFKLVKQIHNSGLLGPAPGVKKIHVKVQPVKQSELENLKSVPGIKKSIAVGSDGKLRSYIGKTKNILVKGPMPPKVRSPSPETITIVEDDFNEKESPTPSTSGVNSLGCKQQKNKATNVEPPSSRNEKPAPTKVMNPLHQTIAVGRKNLNEKESPLPSTSGSHSIGSKKKNEPPNTEASTSGSEVTDAGSSDNPLISNIKKILKLIAPEESGERHLEKGLYPCSYCDLNFFKYCTLSIHLMYHNHYSRYGCSYCLKLYSSIAELKNHLPIHMEKGFKCRDCRIGFTTQKLLDIHLKTYKDRNRLCDNCGKLFVSSRDFFQHNCLYRSQSLDNSLTQDLDVSDTGKDERDSGDSCQNDLKEKTAVSVEENKRLAWGECMCEWCGDVFVDKEELSKHMGAHEKMCDICFQEFPSPSYMRRHRLIHMANEKPYSCKVCNKKFKTLSYCKVHEWTHTGAD